MKSSTKLLWLGGVLFFLIVSFSLLKQDKVVDDEKGNTVPVRRVKPAMEPWVISPDLYSERAWKIHQRQKDLDVHQPFDLQDRCNQFTQHEQLLDVNCTALWLKRLNNDAVTGVDKMWGFEDTHYGAITLNLQNGMKAMFKPCTSKSEDTTKELIASYLDILLGFGQTAPVATRIVPISVVEKYCDTPAKRKALQDTIELCAHEDSYFIGPMIGWWDSLIPIRTVRKYKEELEVIYEQRAVLADSLFTTQKQSRYHAFYWLIHILRHGKDEFTTRHGDLVSLDLDRSKFQKTNLISGIQTNYTWCFTCYMDEWVYDTFQAVGPSQAPDQRLGSLMKEMLSHEQLFTGLWDSRLAVALDTRVEMLLTCVDQCIDKWGRSNVILNEPDTMSARELVEYYITHSAYKKTNGQQGPGDLAFLDQMEWD